jgi:hypothetical protein
VDDEVIVGRTLSYRHDGHGFFVFPADPHLRGVDLGPASALPVKHQLVPRLRSSSFVEALRTS